MTLFIWNLYLITLITSSYSHDNNTNPELCNVTETSLSGKYYVIGLFSMQNLSNNKIDDKAFRLYLKLRYFIGRQQSLSRLVNGTDIGFTAFDVRHSQDNLVSALAEIFLEKAYKPSRTVLNGTTSGWFCDCNTNRSYSSNILAIVSFMSDKLTKLAASITTAENIPFYAYTDYNVISPFESYVYPMFYSSYGLVNNEVYRMRARIRMRAKTSRLVILLNLISDTNKISNFHVLQLGTMLKNKRHCAAVYAPDPKNMATMETIVKQLKKYGNVDVTVVWINQRQRTEFIEELDRQMVEHSIFTQMRLSLLSKNSM